MENILPKTGFDLTSQNDCDTDQIINIQAILTVFIENAMKSAETYVIHSNRKIITAKDISSGLKAELFLFLNRQDNQQRANEIANEFKEELMNEELSNNFSEMEMDEDISDNGYDDNYDDDNYDDDEEDDEEIENNPILPNVTNDTEVYCKSLCNCEICSKINYYTTIWTTWTPTNEIELMLYNSIKKMDEETKIN
mgnify:CR=1 FL=1|jgi:hypothetical protein